MQLVHARRLKGEVPDVHGVRLVHVGVVGVDHCPVGHEDPDAVAPLQLQQGGGRAREGHGARRRLQRCSVQEDLLRRRTDVGHSEVVRARTQQAEPKPSHRRRGVRQVRVTGAVPLHRGAVHKQDPTCIRVLELQQACRRPCEGQGALGCINRSAIQPDCLSRNARVLNPEQVCTCRSQRELPPQRCHGQLAAHALQKVNYSVTVLHREPRVA
mmetsp:Transcript_28727/g.72876  ORF Transcript_28727/g.72876 Transcript_28727/m.72876 type:complete len:213 (-) Transcript_28727:3-641(-)